MLEEYEAEIKTAQSVGLSPHFRVVEEFGEPFYEGDFLEDLFSSMAVADPEHFTYILGEF